MQIKFCGAAREVTGSCHLITLNDGFTILLDCGLYQGGDDDGRSGEANPITNFNEKWLFEPSKINCLVLSHAHIDHTGRVPKLVADGFRGKIYATHATRDLCAIMLLDSAKIQEADADHRSRHKRDKTDGEDLALYTVEDVGLAMRQFVGCSYEQWFHIHPDVRVMYRDAGHILGSASVTLEIKEEGKTIRFGFTGDIGRPNRPILGDPLPMPEVDYLICESTYGDREHESAPNEVDHFVQIVHHTCIEKKGKSCTCWISCMQQGVCPKYLCLLTAPWQSMLHKCLLHIRSALTKMCTATCWRMKTRLVSMIYTTFGMWKAPKN
jgi:metallo-beta-lactamase family protein